MSDFKKNFLTNTGNVFLRNHFGDNNTDTLFLMHNVFKNFARFLVRCSFYIYKYMTK